MLTLILLVLWVKPLLIRLVLSHSCSDCGLRSLEVESECWTPCCVPGYGFKSSWISIYIQDCLLHCSMFLFNGSALICLFFFFIRSLNPDWRCFSVCFQFEVICLHVQINDRKTRSLFATCSSEQNVFVLRARHFLEMFIETNLFKGGYYCCFEAL